MRHIAPRIATLALMAGLALSVAAEPAKIVIGPAASSKATPAIGPMGLALGLFMGRPTGLACRLGLSENQALEAMIAWDFSGSSAVINSDINWLREFPDMVIIYGQRFIPYLGGGLDLGIGTGLFTLGLHAPAGVIYRFAKLPFELFLEFGLGLTIYPSSIVDVAYGLGIRYRF